MDKDKELMTPVKDAARQAPEWLAHHVTPFASDDVHFMCTLPMWTGMKSKRSDAGSTDG